MNISKEQLKIIYPFASQKRIDNFIDPINKAMSEFDINSPLRISAFLAQIGHESGQLRYVEELASGADYEGRKALGNNFPADGIKYKGRGLIQITGRNNYTAVMMALDIDCVEHPELLCEPVNAARSAAWFWHDRDLNQLADTQDFRQITRIINGGYNGMEERNALYEKAKQVLL